MKTEKQSETTKWLSKHLGPEWQIKKKDCPVCSGGGNYFDVYFGQYYPCETCGGSGIIFVPTRNR